MCCMPGKQSKLTHTLSQGSLDLLWDTNILNSSAVFCAERSDKELPTELQVPKGGLPLQVGVRSDEKESGKPLRRANGRADG